MPGYRFQYQVPPTSAALSISRMLSTPSSRSRAPVEQSPETGADDRNINLVGQRLASEIRVAPGVFGKAGKRALDFDVLRNAVGAQSPVPFKGIFLPQRIYVECHVGASTRLQLMPPGILDHRGIWQEPR